MNAQSDVPRYRSVPQRRPIRLGAAVALLAVLLVGAAWWLSTPGATVRSGGDDVTVITGGIHTVHHSLRPLPSPERPRADGLPTLVQFSATWCEICHIMEPVMTQVRHATQGRLIVVEKDLGSSIELARHYRVRGTPTFLVLDASGQELGRPRLILDGDRFLAEVLQIVERSQG